MTFTEQRSPLEVSLDRAGYYPALVNSVVRTALVGEQINAHYVHLDTTFAGPEVRRHITVLTLTPSRLLIAHVDDHAGEGAPGDPESVAAATTESVVLSAVRSVVLTHAVANPEHYSAGDPAFEVSLAIGWGAVSRIDLEPASCADPKCEADHGLSGQISSDDVMLRVSAEAEGAAAVEELVKFAQALTLASGR